ncbi:MAG: sigma-70 family RNA polymerase sigma factor [Paludibacter sp.]
MKIKGKISDYSEENLLRAFVESGDASFFGELYRRYIPLLYGLCLKYLNNKEGAQDAVMDIFELLVEKVPQYEINNFRTWLYSVAKNYCLQVLRKEKQINYINIEEGVVENQAIFTLTDIAQSQEETEALEYCLTTLPDEQRVSINYFFYDDKSYADIVDLTGFALSKVKSYIQNGKRNLKNCIIQVLKSPFRV